MSRHLCRIACSCFLSSRLFCTAPRRSSRTHCKLYFRFPSIRLFCTAPRRSWRTHCKLYFRFPSIRLFCTAPRRSLRTHCKLYFRFPSIHLFCTDPSYSSRMSYTSPRFYSTLYYTTRTWWHHRLCMHPRLPEIHYCMCTSGREPLQQRGAMQ